MLSPSSGWAQLGLLTLYMKGSFGDIHRTYPHSPPANGTIIHDHNCSVNRTVIDNETTLSPTTIPVTHYVDIPVTRYVNATRYANKTETRTIVESVTKFTTTTFRYTVSTTETDLETVSITKTDPETITNIKTDSETITKTETGSAAITKTIFSAPHDPCQNICSISVETVNLYFWPTDKPYGYSSTYVDTALDYTFVSPSVYVFIPIARGTNSLGPIGPSTTNWMLPLDLDEVSTIFDGSTTRQLTLSDLGKDCPQTANPTAITTMFDSQCDPILAAPKQISSWAYPCNACGRLGLFDPPYAIPAVTGGLLGPTTSVVPAPSTTVVPTPSPTATNTAFSTSEDPRTSGGVSALESVTVVSSSSSSTPPTTESVSTSASPTLLVMHKLVWLISSIFIAVYLW